jgi:hypothetical protein
VESFSIEATARVRREIALIEGSEFFKPQSQAQTQAQTLFHTQA